MNNFFTGLFTLLAALSSIALKDYLDRKNVIKLTKKQKAVEVYALVGKLQYSLSLLRVICSNLIIDKNYPYTSIYNSDEYHTCMSILEKIELHIVENFYDLITRGYLLQVEANIVDFNKYLNDIICNVYSQSFNINMDMFSEKTNKYQVDLVNSCHKLRSQMIDSYINVPDQQANLPSILHNTRLWVINFLK